MSVDLIGKLAIIAITPVLLWLIYHTLIQTAIRGYVIKNVRADLGDRIYCGWAGLVFVGGLIVLWLMTFTNFLTY